MWTTTVLTGVDYPEFFNDMLVDNSSNVYLFGTVANEDRQTTYNDYEGSYTRHDYDQYLIKVNNTGSIEWEKKD